MLQITEPEFILLKKFIEDHCGILLEKGKEYLLESRLSHLLKETSCKSFQEFHWKAHRDSTGKLKERIIDAVTTNETFWFRDDAAWRYIRDVAIPHLLDTAEKKGKARVWSCAVSTGQEAYSLLMLLDETATARGRTELLQDIEIVGTDISISSIAAAKEARYAPVAMERGLPEVKKRRYFKEKNGAWIFDQHLKKRVRFEIFNLHDNFDHFGQFDLVLCRYVMIYFTRTLKERLVENILGVLNPGGVLLIGGTESISPPELKKRFKIDFYHNAVIYSRKLKPE